MSFCLIYWKRNLHQEFPWAKIAIKSKGKGKSGGARVITCVKIVEKTVYLLSIYDKADFETITEKDLTERLKEIKKP